MVKSLKMLWRELAIEHGQSCCVSTDRDFKTVSVRVEGEGLSFFAITLPAIGKGLQKGLSDGQVTPSSWPGFGCRGNLPRFLGGFLELIFDRRTGCLLENPNVDAIIAVNSLSGVFGKFALPTSKKREADAIEAWVSCETEVKARDSARSQEQLSDFARVSRVLWRDVFVELDKSIYDDINGESYTLRPKHGPGATADRLRGNAKYDLRYWPQRLEEVFPFGEYCLPNWRYHSRLSRVNFCEPRDELPVRLAAVPKTLKTPRLIAIEPTANQYMQQAVSKSLVDSIERSSLGRVVGFRDQWRNHSLALKGSLDGTLATLDLSEASDRVSNQLVRAMLDSFPSLFEAVDATRSRRADVPGHGVIRLAKFASMGSALTFPIEAMVFLTVVVLGWEKAKGRSFRRSDIKSLVGEVRVYGDDIIVPVDIARDVVESLEAYGLKVNLSKSHWTGRFRESCGREYFQGVDVSIDRLRDVVYTSPVAELPRQRQYVREIESLVSFRNRLYLRGMWRTAKWLDEWIRPVLSGRFPPVETTVLESGEIEDFPWETKGSRSHMLGRWTFLPVAGEKVHPDYHYPVSKGWVISPILPKSEISGEGALLKCLTTEGLADPQYKRHLERAGRPEAVSMKLRMGRVA